MKLENYMYLVPVAAVIALIFAAYLARKVGRQSAGTERMKEIAAAIAASEGTDPNGLVVRSIKRVGKTNNWKRA